MAAVFMSPAVWKHPDIASRVCNALLHVCVLVGFSQVQQNRLFDFLMLLTAFHARIPPNHTYFYKMSLLDFISTTCLRSVFL